MRSARRRLLAVVLLAGAEPALAQVERSAPEGSRPELARFGATLEAAVRRVSRPSPYLVLGPASSGRGFLVPGFGAVFVLPPRALPGDADLLIGEGPDAGRAPLLVWRRDPRSPVPSDDVDRELQRIEVQVEAFQREAERAHQEAERALERVAREIRARLAENTPSAEPAVPPPPAPAPPEPPVPPVPPAPPPPEPAPQPPWRFWFQTAREEDPRPGAKVVSDVRAALVQALESEGPGLALVRPDEYLVVSVDFTLSAYPFRSQRARSERTLVVKARKRDLDARREGRLAGDELRKRIESVEY